MTDAKLRTYPRAQLDPARRWLTTLCVASFTACIGFAAKAQNLGPNMGTVPYVCLGLLSLFAAVLLFSFALLAWSAYTEDEAVHELATEVLEQEVQRAAEARIADAVAAEVSARRLALRSQAK